MSVDEKVNWYWPQAERAAANAKRGYTPNIVVKLFNNINTIV